MLEADVDPDAIAQLTAWLEHAHAAGLGPPDAMTLATATADGRPSARVVLLKDVGPNGLAFYTNRSSRKGRELAENPRAALVFHWPSLGRQLRVEGTVEEIGREEAAAYWASRPLGSRVSATVSPQSEVVASRAWLEERVAALAGDADEPPLPASWGGYRVVPDVVELWEHRDDRLHDRLRYTRDGDAWRLDRLAP